MYPVKTDCNHVFDFYAISGWLTKNSTCPTCRQKVEQKKLKIAPAHLKNIWNLIKKEKSTLCPEEALDKIILKYLKKYKKELFRVIEKQYLREIALASEIKDVSATEKYLKLKDISSRYSCYFEKFK